MDLTQATLRDMLVTIFGVDERYVVPRQGDWFNPQDMLSSAERPLTWCAFDIESDEPIDIAHFQGTTDNTLGNDSVQHRMASVALQLVGEGAQALAYSVGHWIHNQRVIAQFEKIEGRLVGDVGRVMATDFYQDGAHTVKAYNLKFRVAWVSRIPTGQGIMEQMAFQGEVT